MASSTPTTDLPSCAHEAAERRWRRPHWHAARWRFETGLPASETDEQQRALWLDRQLVAMETLAQRLDGRRALDYIDGGRRAASTPRPERDASGGLRAVTRQELDELLPGNGDLRDRLEARDDRLTVPHERSPQSSTGWLPSCAARAAAPCSRCRGRGAQRQPGDRSAVVGLQLVRRRPAIAHRDQYRPARARTDR